MVIVAAYVICGVLTALSAIFFAMYTRSISPSGHGNFYELYAIAAAVLGGFSLARRRRLDRRRRARHGPAAGAAEPVNLLGIPSSLNFAVMGSVILIGVLADQQFATYRQRRALRAQEEARAAAAGPVVRA